MDGRAMTSFCQQGKISIELLTSSIFLVLLPECLAVHSIGNSPPCDLISFPVISLLVFHPSKVFLHFIIDNLKNPLSPLLRLLHYRSANLPKRKFKRDNTKVSLNIFIVGNLDIVDISSPVISATSFRIIGFNFVSPRQ